MARELYKRGKNFYYDEIFHGRTREHRVRVVSVGKPFTVNFLLHTDLSTTDRIRDEIIGNEKFPELAGAYFCKSVGGKSVGSKKDMGLHKFRVQAYNIVRHIA